MENHIVGPRATVQTGIEPRTTSSFEMLPNRMNSLNGPDFTVGLWIAQVLASARKMLMRAHEGTTNHFLR